MAGGQDSSRYATSRPKVSMSCDLSRRACGLCTSMYARFACPVRWRFQPPSAYRVCNLILPARLNSPTRQLWSGSRPSMRVTDFGSSDFIAATSMGSLNGHSEGANVWEFPGLLRLFILLG